MSDGLILVISVIMITGGLVIINLDLRIRRLEKPLDAERRKGERYGNSRNETNTGS